MGFRNQVANSKNMKSDFCVEWIFLHNIWEKYRNKFPLWKYFFRLDISCNSTNNAKKFRSTYSLTSHFSVGRGEKNPENCENEKCEVYIFNEVGEGFKNAEKCEKRKVRGYIFVVNWGSALFSFRLDWLHFCTNLANLVAGSFFSLSKLLVYPQNQKCLWIIV